MKVGWVRNPIGFNASWLLVSDTAADLWCNTILDAIEYAAA
jgi:hypothetical protein